MATVDDAISWSDVLEPEAMERDISPFLDYVTTEGEGVIIHSYIRRNYDLEGTKWEQDVSLNGETLRYDCADENFIYEFKTKRVLNEDFLPENDHVEQLENYLEATDTGLGFLVYISREDFEVKEYPIVKTP